MGSNPVECTSFKSSKSICFLGAGGPAVKTPSRKTRNPYKLLGQVDTYNFRPQITGSKNLLLAPYRSSKSFTKTQEV